MPFERLTTDPNVREPVRLDDLRFFGRIGYVEDHERTERLIRAAREEVERITGVIMRPGTFRVVLDRWASVLDLPLRPVREVTSLRWISGDGAVTTIDPSTFVSDLVAPVARIIVGRNVVTPYDLRPFAGIEMEVAAGYATPEDIPEDVRQHVVTIALLRYEHRDDVDALEKVARYAYTGAGPFAGGDLA